MLRCVCFLLVLLLVVLALWLADALPHACQSTASPGSVTAGPAARGGGGGEASGHEMANAGFKGAIAGVTAAVVTGDHPPGTLVPHLVHAAAAGFLGHDGHNGGTASKGKGSSKGADWRGVATWADLVKDKPALRQYWKEHNQVYSHLALDWTAVRAELAPILRQNREWAGRMDIVDGKPVIVEKLASPFAVGENVSGRTAAMVPAEIVKKLDDKPSLFVFHTHPKGVCELVSSSDVVAAILQTYLGRTAAHVLVTPDSIVLYGVRPSLYNEIWSSPQPHFAALRKAYDAYTAMEGMRSWGRNYKVRDVEALMERHHLFYVVYPLDGYAQLYYNMSYPTWWETDTKALRTMLNALERAEKAHPKKHEHRGVLHVAPLAGDLTFPDKLLELTADK
jgi:hypothetical protein